MTKSTQRIKDAVEGKIPYEELTDRELHQLERLVFDAVVRKVQDNMGPSTPTRH